MEKQINAKIMNSGNINKILFNRNVTANTSRNAILRPLAVQQKKKKKRNTVIISVFVLTFCRLIKRNPPQTKTIPTTSNQLDIYGYKRLLTIPKHLNCK